MFCEDYQKHLLEEFSFDGINPHSLVTIFLNNLLIKALVRCVGAHFTCFYSQYEWVFIDDFRTSVKRFKSVGDLFKAYPNSCFFAIYEDISNNIDHGYCRPIPPLYQEPDHTYYRAIHPVCVIKPMSPVHLLSMTTTLSTEIQVL